MSSKYVPWSTGEANEVGDSVEAILARIILTSLHLAFRNSRQRWKFISNHQTISSCLFLSHHLHWSTINTLQVHRSLTSSTHGDRALCPWLQLEMSYCLRKQASIFPGQSISWLIYSIRDYQYTLNLWSTSEAVKMLPASPSVCIFFQWSCSFDWSWVCANDFAFNKWEE